jgi:arylsulfatase A-like enzyme
MISNFSRQLFVLVLFFVSIVSRADENTNILLIIADDLGVDALNGYDIGTVLPNTPNIDKLRETGLTFTNVWACPSCAPTRASMLTGKYGVNSGVNTVPGILSTNQKSIFKELTELSDSAYQSCVVGKWHNASIANIEQPYSHGAADFMGVNGAGVADYSEWTKVENHQSSTCTEYATSYFTDYAADWINQQTKPWLMWLAHVAPHTPYHVPPADMYTSESVKTNQQKFIVMIEAMDYEIGRLLDSIPQSVLDNTIIIFIGDNGTPGNIIQGFPKPLGKNTVYQGGVNVPMIISGKGVTRINEEEDAMINVSDFYVTMAQIAQADAYPSNQVNDSYSFKHLLSGTEGTERSYNYMELGANESVSTDVYTIRDVQYKIIYDVDGKREMYDLSADPYEATNLLLGDLNDEQLAVKLDLEQQMKSINGISFEDEEVEDTITTSISTNKYSIVDTGISDFYDDSAIITTPQVGEPFYGQDATYQGNQASYTDNGDGTISDNVTGLMWEQNMGEKISYVDAFSKAASSTLGDYDDWRVPTLKEIYSLIQFTGIVMGETAVDMFIDTLYFDQPLGDLSLDEREIDAQTWSSTQYVGLTMNGDTTVFGVNFVDGRIKGYPKYLKSTGGENTMYFRMVRGNEEYGINYFEDNGDGTISDLATGLMWQTSDDGVARDWEEALAYAEALELAGYDDWRLPNAKELQSIVDYTRSPQTTNSPAIDPLFQTTEINDPDGNSGQYPFFWTSTSHLDGINPYTGAAYIAFGEGQGKINDVLMDVHGAGCQRSDPKSGDSDDYPQYWGPQGDVQYVYNYVRCVRDISLISAVDEVTTGSITVYPIPVENLLTIQADRNIEEISIYAWQGVKIKTLNPYETKVQINTSQLTNGVYFILITDDLGNSVSRKVIVKK